MARPNRARKIVSFLEVSRVEGKEQRRETEEKKSLQRVKARIAFEALKGLKTVQQIAAENDLHPDGAGLRVSGGGDGLENASGALLDPVDHCDMPLPV